MKVFLSICFLTAAVLCTVTADVKCYENWAEFIGEIEARCKACQKGDNEATAECFTKADYPLDSEGNLKTDEYLAYQLDEENFIGSGATKDRLKKDLNECLKDGAKTRAELHKVDECIAKAFNDHCEDAKPWLDKLANSEEMKICMS